MKRINLTYLIGMIILLSGSYLYSGTLEDAAKAYSVGDYKKSFQLTLAEARHGNAQAQYNLGLLYCKGQGMNKNYVQGIKWYKAAGKQGHAGAFFNLGIMHEKGLGVKKDVAEAVRWYRQAAAKGDIGAKRKLKELKDVDSTSQPNSKTTQDTNDDLFGKEFGQDSDLLGDMSMDSQMDAFGISGKSEKTAASPATEVRNNGSPGGDNIQSKYPDLIAYYLRQAELGDKKALMNIGLAYFHGATAPDPPVKGFVRIGNMVYGIGSSGPRNVEVAQNVVEAFKWFKVAAEKNGDPEAMNAVGGCYATGQGVKKDATEAIRWLRKAAGLGVVLSMKNLALLYAKGEDVQQNMVEALKWYRKAAELGDIESQGHIGRAYSLGAFGIKKDVDEAEKWLRKAAEAGDANAQCGLGRLLMDPESEKISQEARQWLEKAAAQDNEECIKIMNLVRSENEFTKFDVPLEMKKTLDKANQGDVDAQVAMGSMYYNIVIENNGKPAKDALSAKVLTNALYWFTKAGNQGNLDAQYILFSIYIQSGKPEHTTTALAWHQKALAQKREEEVKNPIAQIMLGNISFEGDCSEKEKDEITKCKTNNEEAFKWYKKAAKQQYVPAYFDLARYYLEYKKDSDATVSWLAKAVEKDHAESKFKLGLILLDTAERKYIFDGDRVGQNTAEGIIWSDDKEFMENAEKEKEDDTASGTKLMCSAADQGYQEAIDHLKTMSDSPAALCDSFRVKVK